MTTQRPACCRWITWDAKGRLREFWPEPSRGPDDAGAFMRIMQAAREVALADDAHRAGRRHDAPEHGPKGEKRA